MSPMFYIKHCFDISCLNEKCNHLEIKINKYDLHFESFTYNTTKNRTLEID